MSDSDLDSIAAHTPGLGRHASLRNLEFINFPDREVVGVNPLHHGLPLPNHIQLGPTVHPVVTPGYCQSQPFVIRPNILVPKEMSAGDGSEEGEEGSFSDEASDKQGAAARASRSCNRVFLKINLGLVSLQNYENGHTLSR